MKKKVYIVSHSHWDREWYMAYEQHHMRLIELVDDLLELFETDPDFNSFHLDGQTIILDDYLQVRPENKDKVQKAIDAGKLRIGPFYILQDDFLTSSESNTRNMLIGRSESEKWGVPVELGYFPDTFGNMGQTPQMMKQARLNAAAFGRGVKPIGFDNQVLEDENYTSQYSEMHWEGPDGTQIFGLLFANWYSNGNEIPAEEKAARKFWDQKLADAEKYASTNHLLMMNGVDHQPVQKNLSKAIALANKLYPEYEFIHSNFPEYLEAVQKDLPEDLGTVHGELTSQETDGCYTLANTASARVYLKQWNTKVSRQLENIAEPLASMAYEVTGKYPHDQLDYAWKTLMQNHPHDSICGCSVDEVHREMMPRFEKANEVGKFVADEALAQITKEIKTKDFPENSHPFVVFNTTAHTRKETVDVKVRVDQVLFSELYPSKGYDKLAAQEKGTYYVVDTKGNHVPAVISDEEILFNYDLPKDGFRIPYMEKFVMVTLDVKDLAGFSWESFALVKGTPDELAGSFVKENGRVLENDFIKAVIEKDGSLTFTNKEINKTLENLLVFEDTGDIANEYIYFQPKGDKAILSTQFPHHVEIVEDNPLKATIRVTHEMEIPKSADDLLDLEQKKIIEFRDRHAKRSTEMIPYPVTTEITINKHSHDLKMKTTIDNNAKDHRLRALFTTGLDVETHEADSIFETVVRNNEVSKSWENPTNPQHQHAFFNLHDENFGLTVSNYGLNEYEVVKDTMALTLIRCVGELADWGYFPTPEAQCLGEHSFEYGIEIHGTPETRFATYKRAHSNQVPLVSSHLPLQEGTLEPNHTYVKANSAKFEVTALKRRKKDDALVLRGYNLSGEKDTLELEKAGNKPTETLNLLEEHVSAYNEDLNPYEIKTVLFD